MSGFHTIEISCGAGLVVQSLDCKEIKSVNPKGNSPNIHWKDWCSNSNTLPTWCEELTHWERPWCWEGLRQEEKGMTEDEMAEWHHWLDGHEFEQAPGVGDGQEAWHAAVHGAAKSQTWLSNWTELTVPQINPTKMFFPHCLLLLLFSH